MNGAPLSRVRFEGSSRQTQKHASLLAAEVEEWNGIFCSASLPPLEPRTRLPGAAPEKPRERRSEEGLRGASKVLGPRQPPPHLRGGRDLAALGQ